MCGWMRLPRSSRRGSYATLYAGLIFVLMVFGAMAIDIGMVRLAISQAQDVSDAASQAALITLRSTASTAEATDAAKKIVSLNTIAGGFGTMEAIEFGLWEDGAFTQTTLYPNAVQVTTSRPVPMQLSRLWGWTDRPVSRTAISASRALHVILVMDITNSWSQANFANARAAAVAFYDRIVAAAGPDDKIGMVVFTGQYGVEHTPLMRIDDAVTAGVRADWNALRTASKAGTLASNGNCNVYTNANTNNFTTPLNGCYPNMWREYADESGTDHTTGMDMAETMFSADTDPTVYRAMLILTDGEPNGTGAHTQRGVAGYNETRWQYFKTNVRRSTSQVISDTQSRADDLWDEREVNIWAVSFVASASWMQSVVQGDGYFTQTSSSSALTSIFEDVAESLPVAIVQ